MQISLNWLKEFVDIPVTPDELSQDLTMLGLEIESMERPGDAISGIRIGRILEIARHPDADKLVVCKTDVGEKDPLQIVCGATNMKVGDVVPTAVVGAMLPGNFKISKRKMRGIESQGMMCSARELGLGKEHEGLLILPSDFPVGADAIPLLGLDDVVFEIEVTPNRGDWASMIGVARELAARYGTKLRIPQVALREEGTAASAMSSVSIEDSDLCPRYIGRVLTDVKIHASPLWLAIRLIHAGQRPINNIVDITNYVLLETGHPLHAFDFDNLLENRIVVRRAKRDETLKTLDEQSRKLDSNMLVIADAKLPVALAGIMGGHDSEVSGSTTRIFLESAFFEPTSIRKTSRKLGLQTEASARFQRGADPEMARFAIDRAAQLIQELAGARIAPGVIDEYPKPLPVVEITLRHDRTQLLLGAGIPGKQQCEILSSLAFEVLEETPEGCKVRVPSWRHDATREADLIEEIARLYGYDRVAATLPRVRKVETVLAPLEESVRNARRFLTGLGLSEMMNMTFTCIEDTERAGLNGAYSSMVMLANPLSEKLQGMRTSLLPGMINAVAANLRHGHPSIRAFEIGPIFVPATEQDLPRQCSRLVIALCGHRHERHWSSKVESFDIFDMKGLLESLFSFLGTVIEWSGGDQHTCFEPGLAGQLNAPDACIGYFGRLRHEIADRFGIEQPVFLAELDADRLFTTQKPQNTFTPYPVFPASLRDMAIVIDADVSASAVLAAANDASRSLLKDVSIFDVYTGKPIPAGKKSIALGFTFQAADRTLTDDEIQTQWDKILKRLQKDFGAQLR